MAASIFPFETKSTNTFFVFHSFSVWSSHLRVSDALSLESRSKAIPLPKAKTAPKNAPKAAAGKAKAKAKAQVTPPEESQPTRAKGSSKGRKWNPEEVWGYRMVNAGSALNPSMIFLFLLLWYVVQVLRIWFPQKFMNQDFVSQSRASVYLILVNKIKGTVLCKLISTTPGDMEDETAKKKLLSPALACLFTSSLPSHKVTCWPLVLKDR